MARLSSSNLTIPQRGSSAARRGYTLIEVLVTIAIIGVLLAILLPMLGFSVRSARGFRCQVSLRSIAFDFSVFADDQLHGDRGNDGLLGPHRFRLETFQESQYGLDEFWRWDNPNSYTLPDAAKNDPMRCSEVRGPITLFNNTPCSQGAIDPPRNISFGFNMRLHRPEGRGPNGQPALLQPVALTTDILARGRVPLAWDVDGAAAEARGSTPVFSAPSLSTQGPYANNRYWYPGRRHNGAANFAFIDGSVHASTHPLDEGGWDWSFQPVR